MPASQIQYSEKYFDDVSCLTLAAPTTPHSCRSPRPLFAAQPEHALPSAQIYEYRRETAASR
jgi:hypothetical protein